MVRITAPLLPLIILLASSCDSGPQQDQFEDGQYGVEASQYGANDQDPGSSFLQDQNGKDPERIVGNEKMVMHPSVDPSTGMVSQQVPYPASWKMTQATQSSEPAIVGPGGVKVYYWNGGSFSYSNDPNMQQTYQMAGQPMRPPVDINTYVQQDVAQAMGNKGMRLVKQYPLPQVAASNQAYMAKLFKSAPSRDQLSAMGTEWTNAKGEPMFMIVNMMVSQTQNFVNWSTFMQVVTAETGAMASAKAALVNSIVNTQYNPQQIAAYNALEQQKSNQSWSQHNARMKDNQRNFEQRQASNKSANEAVTNSIIGSYNSRMQANDAIQHSWSNYLNDENTVRDNSTGDRYQVQTGANQYWMNSNQEYIPSNDVMYDPNADQNVNNQQWQEVEVEP